MSVSSLHTLSKNPYKKMKAFILFFGLSFFTYLHKWLLNCALDHKDKLHVQRIPWTLVNSNNVDTLDCKHSSHKRAIVAYCHQSVPKLECSFDNQPVIIEKKK